MQVVSEIKALKTLLQAERARGRSIGFVPTMGSLHAGHASLIGRSHKENDITVVSIFINPLQFNNSEDLGGYPKNLMHDRSVAEKHGAQILFCPDAGTLYPDCFSSFVTVEGVTESLCGASRPDHFRGVATVVLKLFNIVSPNYAYFGQKDAQQVVVIRKMVRDLDLDLEIVVCPTLREWDGLALSSRNIFLSAMERSQATVLSASLVMAQELVSQGETNVAHLKALIRQRIEEKKLAVIDYIEIVDVQSLKHIDSIECGALLALAVYFGQTRLIDNAILTTANLERAMGIEPT